MKAVEQEVESVLADAQIGSVIDIPLSIAWDESEERDRTVGLEIVYLDERQVACRLTGTLDNEAWELVSVKDLPKKVTGLRDSWAAE